MPASVNVSYLGSQEVMNAVKERLRGLFKDHVGNWDVSVIGGQTNTTWEVKVKGPGDSGYRAKTLYGEDDSLHVEKVVEEVSRLADLNKKSA